MICIYDKNTTKSNVLNTNGLAVLDDICTKAEIVEKLNGEYGLTSIFELDKENKKHEFIIEEAIIKVKDVYGYEVFRVNKIAKRSNRQIEIYARHISYDIANLFLEDVRPTSQNGAGFLDWLFTHTTTSHEFTYASDIETTATSYFVNKNVYDALFTLDNSFMKRLGGEVQRRQYQIAINSKIGSDNGVSIRSRKNLKGFEAYTDIDSVITRIYPKGKDGLVIPEKYIDSIHIGNYANVKSQEVEFPHIGIDTENGITEAMAQQLLRDEAAKMYASGCDLLKGEYRIDFATLEKTEEYKNFAILERTWLGDTVSVFEENYNMNILVRVIERNYNVLKEVHNIITLSNIAEKSMSAINKVIEIIKSVTDTETGFLQRAKDNATELIKNGILNSYVLVRQNEILIMDTDDVNTATKVWRWNNGGLGYSSTGYEGEYGLAMTIDGSIVADFVNVGTLNANLIKAGVLKDFSNKTWISMTDGTFSFADGKITWDGSTFSINADAVKLAVGKIGAKNLFKNGGFKNGLTGWEVARWRGSTSWNYDVWYNNADWTLRDGDCDNISGYLGSTAFVRADETVEGADLGHGLRQKKKVLPNKTYTISALLGLHRCNVTVELWSCDVNYNRLNYIDVASVLNGAGMGGPEEEGWYHYKKTFTTPADCYSIEFYPYMAQHVGGGNDSYLFYDRFQLEEGDNATEWRPSEQDSIDYTTAQVAILNDSISTKVGTSELSSMIEQRASSVQIAFNNITGNVQNSGGKFSILNGSLEVKNNNNIVVIDGTHNMHKIVQTETVHITGTDHNVVNTTEVLHNLGYVPVIAGFQMQNGETNATQTPAFTLASGTGSIGILSVIRLRSDTTKLYIDFVRENNKSNEASYDFYVRYYIYVEAGI